MRTTLLAAVLLVAASAVQAQSPTARLPGQAEPANPSTTTPNSGNDEVAAKRKLEDSGYKDLRGLTPNGDGTMSGIARRDMPAGSRPGNAPDVKVDIDSSGNIKER
jgi:hypothetical protein